MSGDERTTSAADATAPLSGIPTRLELREVIAEYVRVAEPFASTDDIAGVVHAYLERRSHAAA